MTSYDGTGISRYIMVYDRHMTVYDEKSALLLVMDTVVLVQDLFRCSYDRYMLAHHAQFRSLMLTSLRLVHAC